MAEGDEVMANLEVTGCLVCPFFKELDDEAWCDAHPNKNSVGVGVRVDWYHGWCPLRTESITVRLLGEEARDA